MVVVADREIVLWFHVAFFILLRFVFNNRNTLACLVHAPRREGCCRDKKRPHNYTLWILGVVLIFITNHFLFFPSRNFAPRPTFGGGGGGGGGGVGPGTDRPSGEQVHVLMFFVTSLFSHSLPLRLHGWAPSKDEVAGRCETSCARRQLRIPLRNQHHRRKTISSLKGRCLWLPAPTLHKTTTSLLRRLRPRPPRRTPAITHYSVEETFRGCSAQVRTSSFFLIKGVVL